MGIGIKEIFSKRILDETSEKVENNKAAYCVNFLIVYKYKGAFMVKWQKMKV